MIGNYILGQYIDLLEAKGLLVDTKHIDRTKMVTYLSCNSQDIIPGTLFICKGKHFKEQYLQEAFHQGSLCYVSDVVYSIDAPCIIVDDIRKAMAYMSDFYYESIWKKLSLIGITGTKGKSTTCYFVKYIIDAYLDAILKPKSGIISTIHTYDGGQEYESHITTPESIDLHRLFHNAYTNGITYMEMEVSSQALKYDRTLNIQFDIIAFLNIGYDHISDEEHQSFEDYFSSKLQIFKQAKKAIVNLNMDHLEKTLEASKDCPEVYTFGVDTPEAMYYGYHIRKIKNRIYFDVKTPETSKEYYITMPGLFNVQNALAAITICSLLQIPETYIYEGLKKAKVSGRMEEYKSKDNKVVCLVDYAHNALSFENLFRSVQQEYPGYAIHIVFGCPGNKAYDRRKDLAEIAATYADAIYLTEDDPGEEDVLVICNEIGAHIVGNGNTYQTIIDREEAVNRAVLDCNQKTVVLIAGKGNDNSQRRNREYVSMPTDSEYALRALHLYNKKVK